jgi:hypothetical protein
MVIKYLTQLTPPMKHRQFIGKSDERLVRQICQGNLGKQGRKERVMALLGRHYDDMKRGLRETSRPNDPEWRRAAANLGYDDTPPVSEVVEYLLHVPQQGPNTETRRICLFLDDPRSFGDWMSPKLFGLARAIQDRILEEKKNLQKSSQPSEPEGPTLSGPSSSFSPAEAIAEDHEMDRTLDYINEKMKSAIDRAKMLLGQLGRGCRGVLGGFFLSDAPEIPEVIARVEECLDQFADIMEKEDTEPKDFGIGRGKSDLWRCARELSDLLSIAGAGAVFPGSWLLRARTCIQHQYKGGL